MKEPYVTSFDPTEYLLFLQKRKRSSVTFSASSRGFVGVLRLKTTSPTLKMRFCSYLM